MPRLLVGEIEDDAGELVGSALDCRRDTLEVCGVYGFAVDHLERGRLWAGWRDHENTGLVRSISCAFAAA